MLCLAADVLLTAGGKQINGTGRVKVEENVFQVRDLLLRISQEITTYCMHYLQSGKWDVGIYLEITEVPPGLEVFVEWHHMLFDPKKHHLITWEGMTNGKG